MRLSAEEHGQLQYAAEEAHALCSIARSLGRAPSTTSREVSTNEGRARPTTSDPASRHNGAWSTKLSTKEPSSGSKKSW